MYLYLFSVIEKIYAVDESSYARVSSDDSDYVADSVSVADSYPCGSYRYSPEAFSSLTVSRGTPDCLMSERGPA